MLHFINHGAYSHEYIFCMYLFFSVCPKCVLGDGGLTCCAKGGAWHGKCTRDPANVNPEYTWAQGFEACSTATWLNMFTDGTISYPHTLTQSEYRNCFARFFL